MSEVTALPTEPQPLPLSINRYNAQQNFEHFLSNYNVMLLTTQCDQIWQKFRDFGNILNVVWDF